MSGDIVNLGLRELRALLEKKAMSAGEMAAVFLGRARRHSRLNAFLRVYDDASEAAGGGGDSPVAGTPIAHKDIFCARGEKTTCGSAILENFISPYDSAVTERCRRAGMVALGRTNMDEFAMGSSGEHSAFGAARNPWDETRTPGGSSSGSAAAVAARLTPAATATDTGGSIRQPAAFCGVTGIKPTYGRVSRWGMVAFASSFDQGGVIAKSAEDCARVLSAIAGFDERDSTSARVEDEDFSRLLERPVAGRVIGIAREHFGDGLDDGVAGLVLEGARRLEKMGARLRDVSLPATRLAIPAYYVLTCAEASSNLSRYDGARYGMRVDADDLGEMTEKTRAAGFGWEAKRRILIGAHALSYGYYDAYYRRAMKARKLIADDFSRAFLECDLILGPTTPNTAFPLGSIADADPVSMYMQDIHTVPVNLAGLPALSAPCGFVGGLPAGMQLIGPAMGEALLLSVAHQHQQMTDFHARMPEMGE